MSKINCIDVSYCQKKINFNAVKADGIEAVIVRAGYGRETSQKDSQFENHYSGAKSAGLKVGAYWYSYADSVDDARREARACLSILNCRSLDMPIYYDLEDNSQTGFEKSMLTDMAVAFCEEIKASGYRAGIYANLNWFRNYLDYDYLKSKYSIWLAQYASNNNLDCDIWQNASDGDISGISGNVDTNIIYNNDVFSNNNDSGKTSSNAVTNANNCASVPDVTYCVRTAESGWLPEVDNLEDYAGVQGQAITDIAINFTKGEASGWYQVHTVSGKWLPPVTWYDISDDVNGYAGNHTHIDAVRCYYNTPDRIAQNLGYLCATYRVSPVGGNYYDWQKDDSTGNGMDGYAGCFGTAIDRFQLVLSK